MSQTFFSKLDPQEKLSRLSQLGQSKGQVTVWIKGQKEKSTFNILDFDKERVELVLDLKKAPYSVGTVLLCNFDLRGMSFFSQVTVQKSIVDYVLLEFKYDLFKSERRSSFRLLTYPVYKVWSMFELKEVYDGGKVVDFKTKRSQTALFKNFLNIVEGPQADDAHTSLLKIRVQDLSTTGMALHITDIENHYFSKDQIYKNVDIHFLDEIIQIPEVKVVYVVDYIGNDKQNKKYKVGLTFPNLPIIVDEQLGKKINKLLRDVDFNKDFENFLK